MAAKFRSKKFTVHDGKIELVLETCEEGGYAVTAPADPAVNTMGDTIEECFAMAYDAMKLLAEYRRSLQPAKPKRRSA